MTNPTGQSDESLELLLSINGGAPRSFGVLDLQNRLNVEPILDANVRQPFGQQGQATDLEHRGWRITHGQVDGLPAFEQRKQEYLDAVRLKQRIEVTAVHRANYPESGTLIVDTYPGGEIVSFGRTSGRNTEQALVFTTGQPRIRATY